MCWGGPALRVPSVFHARWHALRSATAVYTSLERVSRETHNRSAQSSEVTTTPNGATLQRPSRRQSVSSPSHTQRVASKLPSGFRRRVAPDLGNHGEPSPSHANSPGHSLAGGVGTWAQAPSVTTTHAPNAATQLWPPHCAAGKSLRPKTLARSPPAWQARKLGAPVRSLLMARSTPCPDRHGRPPSTPPRLCTAPQPRCRRAPWRSWPGR